MEFSRRRALKALCKKGSAISRRITNRGRLSVKWLCGLVVKHSNGGEIVLFIFNESYDAFCL